MTAFDRLWEVRTMVVISLQIRVFCFRMMETLTRRVERHGGAPYSWHRHQPVSGYRRERICKYWKNGNCTRSPCRFLHPDRVSPMNPVMPLKSLISKQSHDLQRPSQVICKRVKQEKNFPIKKLRTSPENAAVDTHKMSKVPQRNHPVKPNGGTQTPSTELNDCGTQKPSVNSNVGTQTPSVDSDDVGTKKPSVDSNVVGTRKRYVNSNEVGTLKPPVKCSNGSSPKVQHKICEKWIKNICTDGEKCKYMHSWSSGDGFSRLAQLEGHNKAITGISLPVDFDKLFTGSEDGTVCLWNCNSGECIATADMGAPVGCMVSEGSWVFAGVTNAVKAWNIKTGAELTLDVPAGRVYSLAVSDNMLFAGHQDGSIYIWKLNFDASLFEAVSILKGHSGTVVSLIFGANRLYSGSIDKTIRVWDVEKMLCLHTLRKHSEVVMSVLCWELYLLSSSLDNTLQVWAATEAGELEVIHTHKEEHGILSLSGMHDTSGKPILLCACNDNSVRLYELPSFIERGRIFAKEEVRTMHAGPKGLFFTGDGSGSVSVWKCSGELNSLTDSC